MGQGRFPVPQRGRKREWYLMKGCLKDYSNLLESNRERVAFIIFCVLLFFFKKLLWHGNEADFKAIILNAFFIYYINKSLHFTINTFCKHFSWKKWSLLADLRKKNLGELKRKSINLNERPNLHKDPASLRYCLCKWPFLYSLPKKKNLTDAIQLKLEWHHG